MLAKARALKLDGVDVVIGLVETHGRRETEALVEGLEILPRRKIEYRGRIIEEFDIDAALARKPKLMVVDELAHTNAPDSRHPKRWQDVEELLDAGVDVWTALNIQHLESLADVVSRITGITVRETVPDRVLQEAADVILVDITPDELLQRLKEGKVYVPETAKRATQNFFTPEILPLYENSRCGARRIESTIRWSTTCVRTPSKGRGRPRSACWFALAVLLRRNWSCAWPRASRPVSTPLGSRFMSSLEVKRKLIQSAPSASTKPSGLQSGWAARSNAFPGRTSPEKCCALRDGKILRRSSWDARAPVSWLASCADP